MNSQSWPEPSESIQTSCEVSHHSFFLFFNRLDYLYGAPNHQKTCSYGLDEIKTFNLCTSFGDCGPLEARPNVLNFLIKDCVQDPDPLPLTTQSRRLDPKPLKLS